MKPSADDFEAYVRARSPGLLRTAYLLTGDQHRAEDLVQDALIRTHRAWHKLHDSNPDAYTRKVMYHLNIAWWRRGRGIEIPLSRVPEPGRTSSTTGVDAAAMRAALLTLPPRQRAVVVLRFFEDLTETATAEVLGVAVGTVKSQMAKALSKLRAVAPQLLDLDEREGAFR